MNRLSRGVVLAGIRNYPNDDKLTNTVVRVLSILTALVAIGCVGLILLASASGTLKGYLPK